MMDYEYFYDQKKGISDEDWRLISHRISLFYNRLFAKNELEVYEAIRGGEDKIVNWSYLFPNPILRDDGRSICNWDIDGDCIAFSGGIINRKMTEPFILPKDYQLLPTPHVICTSGHDYDLLVRAIILIVHNTAKGAYHFSVREDDYLKGEVKAYWGDLSNCLTDMFGKHFGIPFPFKKMRGSESMCILIPKNWTKDVTGIEDSYF